MQGRLAGFIDRGCGELSCEPVGHGSPVNHLAVDKEEIHFDLALIKISLLILQAVRRESKLDFRRGIIDVTAKTRIYQEGLSPIQLWDEVDRAQVGDILRDFDILFIWCIVRMIDVDVIVSFDQIDGEVAAEVKRSATNAFDEDRYTLDTLVLSVENLALNSNFFPCPLIHRARLILLEILISHIQSIILLGAGQKSEI